MAWSAAAAMLATPAWAQVRPLELVAETSRSQFATPLVERLELEDGFAEDGSARFVQSFQEGADGFSNTSAEASVLEVIAFFNTANTGIAKSSAGADAADVGMVFRDNAALRNLMSDDGTVDLLLNFEVQLIGQTNPTLGSSAQATVSADARIEIRLGTRARVIPIATGRGRLSIQNGPFARTVTASGFFEGLPDTVGETVARTEGQVDVQLPLTLRPDQDDGLFARYAMLADVNGLALSAAFSGALVEIGLPLDKADFVTLPADGGSALDHGVEFFLSQDPGLFADRPTADLDANGRVDVFDLLSYIGHFAAGDPEADMNDDGGVDVFDLLAFIGLFVAGA